MFETDVIDVAKHILCSMTLSENLTVHEVIWKKYSRIGQAAAENII